MFARECPVLLLTPQQFKLLWFDKASKRIHTYPSWSTEGARAEGVADYQRTSLMGFTDDDSFLQVLYIVLRAGLQDKGVESLVKKMEGVSVKEDSRRQAMSKDQTPWNSKVGSSRPPEMTSIKFKVADGEKDNELTVFVWSQEEADALEKLVLEEESDVGKSMGHAEELGAMESVGHDKEPDEVGSAGHEKLGANLNPVVDVQHVSSTTLFELDLFE
jgi:hypothetical protein